jgi:hypothetical protein
MKPIKYLLLCCALLIFASVVQLHAQDAKGCKDSPLITRMPGSTIRFCKDEEFGQADLPLAGNKQKHVEGEYHVVGIRRATVRPPCRYFGTLKPR